MSRVPLLTTGLSGLVGSKLAALYEHEYDFDNLDISHPTRPIDITDSTAVRRVVASSPAQALIHFAAFTDVSKAWEQREDKSGVAYRVNVTGTQNLVRACEDSGKHFIHISTAYVFDGEKATSYTESDAPNPIEWYGYTKAEAETVVQNSTATHCILRIDQPFRSDAHERPDIVRRIAAGLTKGSLPPQFTDHTFGPTFIDDFARVLHWVVTEKITGLYHASSGEQWSDYDFARKLQELHRLPGEVQPGKLENYLKTLSRPYQRNTALDTTKLQTVLPFSLSSVEDALTQVSFNSNP